MAIPQSGIYRILNTTNQKVYIGSSANIFVRWRQHRKQLRGGYSHNTHLQAAWRLAGENEFFFSVLEECEKKDFKTRESYWIRHYNACNPEKGYNQLMPDCYESSALAIRHSRQQLMAKRGLRRRLPIVCINAKTGEMSELTTHQIEQQLHVPSKKVQACLQYWNVGRVGNTKRSCRGYLFVRKREFDPNYNYLGRNRTLEFQSAREKKPRKVYYQKKDPANIVPAHLRNRPRTKVIATNLATGEQTEYPSISWAARTGGFNLNKIQRCVASEPGKYQHRGYSFCKA